MAVGLTLLAMSPAAMGAGPLGGREATVSEVVAEGQYSGVSGAFVAVVRDAGTYAALRGVVGELPKRSAEFFESNAIVAAFLGMRPTKGYGVMVSSLAGGVLRISEATPSGGAKSPGVPPSPFKVVSVQMNDGANLDLEVDDAWKAMRPYRVSEGEFASRGGIVGRTETFRLEGDVRLARLRNLVTFAFDLKSAGPNRSRRLRSFATGIADSSGGFRVLRLQGGGLVGWPNGGLRATGRLTNSNRLALSFEPLPSDVSDGFEGRGKLEAVAVGAADHG